MQNASRDRIPRDPSKDYTEEMAGRRRQFIHQRLGTGLDHVAGYSFDPGVLPGNVENFIGVAQVPIGVAGPIRVHGEHANGDFFVPLATTEGTLVASYNRGMRLLTEGGGVRVTVVEESMQRSPAFSLGDALQARELGRWVDDHVEEIRQAAERTTRSGRLTDIGQYVIGPLMYLRFNYTTGDAAGQNLTGRATLAACEWIRENHPEHPSYILSGNMDTDKKHSRINMLLTRGKRVVAEATVDRDLVRELMGVDTRDLYRARQVSQAGAFLVGVATNGAYAAN